MIDTSTDYRAWLRNELAERCRRNRQYSLRAFARDLELLPSHLSDVLHRKQGLSAKSATTIARRLGLGPAEETVFVTLVESEHARSRAARQAAKQHLKRLRVSSRHRSLREDVFAVVADWYHFAILELIQCDDFEPRLDWIATRLGISVVEAERAVERLVATGLLERRGESWVVTERFPAAGGEIASAAVKRFHSQILEKAAEALYLQAVAKRDFSCITFAFNPADLPALKEEVKRFRRRIERKYKARSGKKQVYAMSTQLFALTGGRDGNA